jgi:hypothetical protein
VSEIEVVAVPHSASGAARKIRPERGYVAIATGTGQGYAAGRAVTVGATAWGPGEAAGSGVDLDMASALAPREPLPVVMVCGERTMPLNCSAADMAAHTPSGAGVVESAALVGMKAAFGVEAAFGVVAQHKRHCVQD